MADNVIHFRNDRRTGTSISRRSLLRCVGGLALSCAASSRVDGAVPWTAEDRFGIWYLHASFALENIRQYRTELGDLERRLGQSLALPKPRQPVHVMLLADQRQYRRYLETYFPQAPIRPALFLQVSGPGMVFAYRSPEMWTNLRHEGTHAILHSVLPFVPLWIDEGLAEFFEREEPAKLAGHPHLKPLRRELRQGPPMPLEQLEAWTDLGKMTGRDYRHAWSWVYYLLESGPRTRQLVSAYLHAWGEGRVPLALSQTLAQLQSDPTSQYGRFWSAAFERLN